MFGRAPQVASIAGLMGAGTRSQTGDILRSRGQDPAPRAERERGAAVEDKLDTRQERRVSSSEYDTT